MDGSLDNRVPVNHKTSVFARFGHLLLIVALLCATGTHWMVLQSVAWATMLADNASRAPLSTAIQKTFDGKHLCPLCKQIAEGRQSEQKSDLQTEFKQLEFLNSPVIFSLLSPAEYYLLPELNISADLLLASPPVPPPRTILG